MKERLKTISIILLIVVGLTQVGILWSYQSQGTPTGFISGLFGLNKVQPISDKVVRERLFEPDRLILSDGSRSYWIVGDDRREFSTLWNEAKNGLNRIVSGDVKLLKFEDSWASAVEKRGALIDFGYVMDSDLLAWFLGAVNPSQELPAIRKLMINRDITDEYTSIFYIYGSDGVVYSSEPIRYEEAMNLYEAIDNVSVVSRKYSSLAGGKIAKENDEPDVLYAVAQYWEYNEFSLAPIMDRDNGDELASIIIGAEKDRYNKRVVGGNTIQFSYGDNIYRYHEDGYMTYRYLRDAYPSGKGQVGKALLNAYKLVAGINERIENAEDITLTSVENLSDGVYQFGFDYKVKGMPVKVNIGTKDGKGERLNHAISVQADSKRVLRCDWLLKRLVQGAKSNYNDRFIDLLGSAELFFPSLSIQDIYSCYMIDSSDKELLKPVLLIRTKDQKDPVIEMIPEKGE